MTKKELYKYCVDRGLYHIEKAGESGDVGVRDFCRARGMTFLHIAACIYEDSIPETHGKESQYDKERTGKKDH